MIFIFMAFFWCALSIFKTSRVYNSSVSINNYNDYMWAFIISGYQLIQALFRIPMGIFSRKIISRKTPLMLAATTIIFCLVIILAFDFASWTIIMAMILSGIFASTFGLQNQYWSENYNLRSVFISIGIMAILPTFGSLFASFISALSVNFSIAIIRWTFFIFTLLGIVILLLFLKMQERKNTIKLDNVTSTHHKLIYNLKLKSVLAISLQIFFATFAFNMLTTKISYQDAISIYSGLESIILSLLAIVVFLGSAFYLFGIFNTKVIVFIFHSLMLGGTILGLIFNAAIEKSFILRLIYLSIITTGFIMFQNILGQYSSFWP